MKNVEVYLEALLRHFGYDPEKLIRDKIRELYNKETFPSNPILGEWHYGKKSWIFDGNDWVILQ